MTLNGVMVFLRFFHRIRLPADYVTVVEDTYNVRKILSLSSSLTLLAIADPRCSAVFLR